MMNITFQSQDTEMPDFCSLTVRQWVVDVAASYDKEVGEINYIFVSDERILQINREFLGHDYYTDHIGFDYCEADILSGDIFISVDTVRTNALQYDKTFSDELHRVIIHGVLHLCGLADKTPDERRVMEEAEDKALALFYKSQD